MEKTCNDEFFGEMIYKHRWIKKQNILLFGKEWDVTIAAKAYLAKPITEDEQRAYIYYLKHEKDMLNIVEEKTKEYINNNLNELAANWVGARKIINTNELAQVVIPKTLLFKQDGTTIMLLDCVWSDEGIAVKLAPEVSIGTQAVFL